MSESEFMRSGEGRLVLIFDGRPPYPIPWPIKVYEIGEEKFVGVKYPDNVRQVHSRSWWASKLRHAKEIVDDEQPVRKLIKPRHGEALGVPRLGYPMADGKSSLSDSPVEPDPPIVRRPLVRKAVVEEQQQPRAKIKARR